jgi:hypothetical protein
MSSFQESVEPRAQQLPSTSALTRGHWLLVFSYCREYARQRFTSSTPTSTSVLAPSRSASSDVAPLPNLASVLTYLDVYEATAQHSMMYVLLSLLRHLLPGTTAFSLIQGVNGETMNHTEEADLEALLWRFSRSARCSSFPSALLCG